MTTEVQAAITLTPFAAGKLQDLLQERDDPDVGLRIFISGSSCSGMQYGMAIETDAREVDEVFESEGVKVIVDPNSLMYLAGARVDYVESKMGSGFAIHNPNVAAGCGGCGHSCSDC